MNGLQVKNKIKEHGMPMKDVALAIGESEQSLQSMFKAKDIKVGVLQKLADAIEKDISYFFEPLDAPIINKENPLSKSVQKHTNYKPTSELIPMYNVDFIAGTAFDAVENPTSKPDYYMDIPDFRGCTAFKAYSDSMEGLIKSGSILFGTKVERWNEFLEYGQIYGIVCEDGRKFLKYIKRYKDAPKEYFLLASENDFYEDFEMPKKFIRSIWLVHGHLTKRV